MLLFVVSVPFIVLLANCKQIFVCGNNDISKYVATYWQQQLRNEQALNATLPKMSKQQQPRDFLHNNVATLCNTLQRKSV